MFKRIWRKLAPNPLDRILKQAVNKNAKKFLIAWNRGLGDLPLGLYALVYRIREFIPDAAITFLTRPDLKDAFELLEDVQVLVGVRWQRGVPFELESTLAELSRTPADFDVILAKPDPTYWLKWQLGQLVPKLRWKKEWDQLCGRFGLADDEKYIAVHVQTETNYAYQKNWPIWRWQSFFKEAIAKYGYKIILFGFKKEPVFDMDGLVDLRGDTTVFEMLSLIKNRSCALVVPDSGILSLTYYLAETFPLKVVSLWADARQGVLKQKVASPNPLLVHVPLIGAQQDVSQISVEGVFDALLEPDYGSR